MIQSMRRKAISYITIDKNNQKSQHKTPAKSKREGGPTLIGPDAAIFFLAVGIMLLPNTPPRKPPVSERPPFNYSATSSSTDSTASRNVKGSQPVPETNRSAAAAASTFFIAAKGRALSAETASVITDTMPFLLMWSK